MKKSTIAAFYVVIRINSSDFRVMEKYFLESENQFVLKSPLIETFFSLLE